MAYLWATMLTGIWTCQLFRHAGSPSEYETMDMESRPESTASEELPSHTQMQACPRAYDRPGSHGVQLKWTSMELKAWEARECMMRRGAER